MLYSKLLHIPFQSLKSLFISPCLMEMFFLFFIHYILHLKADYVLFLETHLYRIGLHIMWISKHNLCFSFHQAYEQDLLRPLGNNYSFLPDPFHLFAYQPTILLYQNKYPFPFLKFNSHWSTEHNNSLLFWCANTNNAIFYLLVLYKEWFNLLLNYNCTAVFTDYRYNIMFCYYQRNYYTSTG